MMRYWGKYKGFVRDNADPENRGRIRAYCPQVMGPADGGGSWLGWAEPCFPWLGGMNTGDFGPPLTKAQQFDTFGAEWYGVWIEFQQGNPDHPIWIGSFTIARTPSASAALSMPVPGGAGIVGGGVLGSSVVGDQHDALNPPQAELSREVRLRTPKGVDIVIGSESGGYIVIGPNGVHITGVAISLNGVSVIASSTKVCI